MRVEVSLFLGKGVVQARHGRRLAPLQHGAEPNGRAATRQKSLLSHQPQSMPATQHTNIPHPGSKVRGPAPAAPLMENGQARSHLQRVTSTRRWKPTTSAPLPQQLRCLLQVDGGTEGGRGGRERASVQATKHHRMQKDRCRVDGAAHKCSQTTSRTPAEASVRACTRTFSTVDSPRRLSLDTYCAV